MIQFNLLPDVKLEYIRAERQRRFVIVIASLVTGSAILLVVLILSANGLQKKHLSDLNADITAKSAQLKNQDNVDRVLTVQNQLSGLTALHESKPAAARLSSYLNQVTPASVSISNFSIDFAAQTVAITGNADSISDVNKYADTLKYTNYSTADVSDKTKAFHDVVLSAFSVNGGGNSAAKSVSYTISLGYDLTLFDTKQKVNLEVPVVTTTRSTDLFQAAPVKKGN